jgi:hypothetical protein
MLLSSMLRKVTQELHDELSTILTQISLKTLHHI